MYFNSLAKNLSEVSQIENTIITAVSNMSGDVFLVANKYLWHDFMKLILLVIISSSMIALPMLFVYILYEGVTLGFTIATIISAYGIFNGNILAVLILFLPSILSLSMILIITVSSIKLVENILKMRKPVRIEIMRHLMVSMFFAITIIITYSWRIFAWIAIGKLIG